MMRRPGSPCPHRCLPLSESGSVSIVRSVPQSPCGKSFTVRATCRATHHLRRFHDVSAFCDSRAKRLPFDTVRQDFHSSCAPGSSEPWLGRLADHAQPVPARAAKRPTPFPRHALPPSPGLQYPKSPSLIRPMARTDVAIPITRQCPPRITFSQQRPDRDDLGPHRRVSRSAECWSQDCRLETLDEISDFPDEFPDGLISGHRSSPSASLAISKTVGEGKVVHGRVVAG